MQLHQLVERANSHTGNALLTAEALGVSRNRVYDWKNGVRPCPVEVQAQLCQLAGLSSAEAWEHIKSVSGSPKKTLAAVTAAAFALVFAGSLGIGGAPSAAADGGLSVRSATMYIM